MKRHCKQEARGQGEYAHNEDEDGFYEVYINTMGTILFAF